MFDNHGRGDSTGLEVVFQSQEFGRAVGGAAPREGVARPGEPEEIMLRREFGHTTSPVGAAPAGEERRAASPSATLPQPPKKPYRMAAVLSGVAAVAFVIAGVTSGAGQHRPPVVSARGKHTTGGSHAGSPPSGGGLAGTAATGGATLTVALGSGAQSTSSRTGSPFGSGGAPSGQVTLSGAASTTGTAVPAPVTPPPGATGSAPPPASAGSNAVSPVGSPVGDSVTAVVTSVTDAADQLGTSVPSTASTTGAVGTAVSGVGQAVSSASS